MKVGDQMHTDPLTVSPDTPVGEVAKKLVDGGRRQVMVVEGERLLGLVTPTDLIAKHAKLHFPTYFSLLGFSFPVEARREDRDIQQALATTAGDLMSTDLITIGADADLDDAATLMLDNEISCLPVVEEGRLVGSIDETDVVRVLVVEEGS